MAIGCWVQRPADPGGGDGDGVCGDGGRRRRLPHRAALFRPRLGGSISPSFKVIGPIEPVQVDEWEVGALPGAYDGPSVLARRSGGRECRSASGAVSCGATEPIQSVYPGTSFRLFGTKQKKAGDITRHCRSWRAHDPFMDQRALAARPPRRQSARGTGLPQPHRLGQQPAVHRPRAVRHRKRRAEGQPGHSNRV